MPSQDSINSEVFGRITSIEKTVAEMKGMFAAYLEQNDRLLKTITLALKILGVLCLIELLVIIYGAIGKDGLHSVRDSIPKLGQCVIAPWTDTLCKWKA